MTFKEFGIIADAIKTYFPRDNVLPTENAMSLWYDGLKDLSYPIVNIALKKYVQTNKFAPTIADIREQAALLDKQNQNYELNETKAWSIVWKAICNSGYHAEEEFEKLPPIIQKTVGSPAQLREWAMLEDIDGNTITVLQSNFQRTFRVEQKRENDRQKLSPEIRKLLKSALENPKIETQQRELTVSEERMIAEKRAVQAPEGFMEEVKRRLQMKNE